MKWLCCIERKLCIYVMRVAITICSKNNQCQSELPEIIVDSLNRLSLNRMSTGSN